ncbi:GNAT family N-acetyltransferase [Candidatus Leptofilum sp.]|uniref:GNAT family N-acetyltransferase n=1 Tax=Candidatus Leptofilum sp. TaxID=3241576 RepID=UPI003B598B59
MQVYIARTDSEIAQCYSVMVQLLPDLKQSDFVIRVRRLSKTGYTLAYLEDYGLVCAVAGFRIVEMLSSFEPYLVIDEIVADESKQRQGYGNFLFDWLIQHAKKHHCKQIHLDSSVRFVNAHRFYFQRGMHIQGYHFILPLPD